MNDQVVLDLARQALLMMLQLAAPFLLTALVVGLVIGILQSLTQIQEQTLTFVPKLVVMGMVFVLALPWMLQSIVGYTRSILVGLADLPR
ncbi:MAG: flagellar biosynthesis protein FliQ [Gemmatimonadaceae bacterium]|nr:flagellar biosynthesis protein FliQ [Gemmatimonadaceae bacterium]